MAIFQDQQQASPASPSKMASGLALAAFVLLCFLAGLLGTLATIPNIPIWYTWLEKPPLTPPNVVFPIAWTILYALMAIAAWLTWRASGVTRWQTLLPFFIQLALNAVWSWAFFGNQSPIAGAVVIVALLVAIAWTIWSFRAVDRLAALLLVPYFAWVCFATYLNFGILILNG